MNAGDDSCYNDIVAKTTGEIRTFLSALANGTSHYKSLHNLTEQIEHQYHGRFLIELLQNAHDALYEQETEGDKGRVDIVVATEEIPFGTLYISNDGEPFSPLNFLSLANFGQSNKDPEKSIGNKGIGFRSVLEICREPEIYSRRRKESPIFDGYCFRFSPDVIHTFKGPISRLAAGQDSVPSPIDPNSGLVLWGEEELRLFRERYLHEGSVWIAQEMAFLSPYLLPIPIPTDGRSQRVMDFEKNGFSTVIRLPFVDQAARELTISQLANFNENTVLFLNRIKSMYLDSGDSQRLVGRHSYKLDGTSNGEEIAISVEPAEQGKPPVKQYRLWGRKLGGKENPLEAAHIGDLVADLPGKWPSLREATVTFAVRKGETPEEGFINIFLPTEVRSGCWAHINGPFYGDMSRTHVDFSKDYNKFLLKCISERASEVIEKNLQGKNTEESRSIVDLLSPISGESGKRWWSLLVSVFEATGANIQEKPIVLTDKGWKPINLTSVVPAISIPKVFTERVLRSCASFPIFHETLTSRESQLIALFKAANIDLKPLEDDLLDTVEIVAKRLHSQKKGADWNGFWEDMMQLFPNNSEQLKGRKLIFGTDGQLHASSETSSVFFRPRSVSEGEDELPDEIVNDIPKTLQPHIAFLSEDIQTRITTKEGRVHRTAVQGYLASVLVQTFRVEDILREVLIANTPQLPIPLKSSDTHLCMDILQWGLKLTTRLFASGKGESIIDLVGKLPAPCHGGWYPLKEASFGRGWKSGAGTFLEIYLQAAKTETSREALKKVLLPSHDHRWGGSKNVKRETLEKAGVFDGLRLRRIDAKEWKLSFYVGGSGIQLPDLAPPCFNAKVWENYKNEIYLAYTPNFSRYFTHVIEPLAAIPGIERWEELGMEGKKAFSSLVLKSLPKWDESWKKAIITKTEGRYYYYHIEAALHYFLRNSPWIISDDIGGYESFRPQDRWYIDRRTLSGRIHQFAHLKPAPASVTAEIGTKPELISCLENLGMPVYDLEKKTNDLRLLTALAEALEKEPESITDRNVFLGQVRDAWRNFSPKITDTFPKKIIVHEGTGKLAVFTPQDEEVCYLPDVNLADKEVFENNSVLVVAIEVGDARLLSGLFKKAYGNAVQLISELSVKPLVRGEEWSEAHDGLPLLNSHLEWIIPILLSVFANYGGNARGAQTKRFREIMDILRESRVYLAPDLERSVWREEKCITRVAVKAYWSSRSKILLYTDDCSVRAGLLSEALAALLDRPDLDTALKLVLGNLQGEGPFDRNVILSALRDVHVSDSQYAEAEQLWLGNLAWAIRLLHPVLLLSNSEINLSKLVDVKSEEALRESISALGFDLLPVDDCLSLVRSCRGFEELGRKLFERIGERAELAKWNMALSRSEQAVIRNTDAKDEFNAHVQRAAVPLRAILRKWIAEDPRHGALPDLWKQIESMQCPELFETEFWSVPFGAAMGEIGRFFLELDIDNTLPEVVMKAETLSGLTGSLTETGVEPSLDPFVVYADNRERFLNVLQGVHKVVVAWCIKNKVAPDGWDVSVEDLFKTVEVDLKTIGYLATLDDKGCLNLIKRLPHKDTHAELWRQLDASKDVESLRANLEITTDEIAEAGEGLRRYKEEAQRKKRTISVCGKDFECVQENFTDLWNHISAGLGDNSLPELELGNVIELVEPPRKKSSSGGTHKSGRTRTQLPQAVKDLIGLAGEIHAYRALLNQYGAEVINPSVWKSSNSLYRFPDNVADDSIGCDFFFSVGSRQYHLEVKATQGEDEAFDLGVTEIRHAIEVANKKNTRFMILHVPNALTQEPKFRLLPNPYDDKYRRFYSIEEAGLRVRYRLSNEAPIGDHA